MLNVEVPIRQKYANFRIFVRSFELEVAPYWLPKDIYKVININNGEFIGIIHNGISNFIVPGQYYRIWFEQKYSDSKYLNVVFIDEES